MVNKVAQRAIAAGLAGMMSFGAVAPAAMALDTNNQSSWWGWNNVKADNDLTYWKRLQGSDRYGTMKEIVKATYNISGDNWWRASVAVIASGDNFPDALAANGLAGALNDGDGAPVILTKRGALSTEAKDLLKKMSVQTVYIMGGTSAVSEDVEKAIKDMKIATIRVAGADRQATSVEAFKLIDGNWYKHHGTHSVIIATGANYADALSIAPFAYRTGTPIVLTKADGTLTDEAVKAIKDNDEIYQVIVVGGTAAVSDSVFSVLGTYNGNYKDYYNKVYVPVRIAGADRYDTSAKIADWEVNYAYDITDDYAKNDYWKKATFAFYETFVATGENFPDALAGGQLAGGKYYASTSTAAATRWGNATYTALTIKAGSPILLTKDGNRAADSVIASNLAWNYATVSVDSYEFLTGNVVDYVDDYLNGYISGGVYANDAYGFFTGVDFANDLAAEAQALYKIYLNTLDEIVKCAEKATNYKDVDFDPEWPYDAGLTWDDATAKSNFDVAVLNSDKAWLDYEYAAEKVPEGAKPTDVSATKVAWFDGYRVKDNTFKGTILGGVNAVSKDKAKQLDQTVKDSIYKINDPVATNDTGSVTINGKTYHTLGWLNTQSANVFSSIGVEGLPVGSNKVSYKANEVVAVPYDYWNKYGYQFLYQPIDYDIKVTEYSPTSAAAVKETVTIKMAKFDAQAAFAGALNNSYCGYGLTGYGTLTLDYDYSAKTVVATWSDGI